MRLFRLAAVVGLVVAVGVAGAGTAGGVVPFPSAGGTVFDSLSGCDADDLLWMPGELLKPGSGVPGMGLCLDMTTGKYYTITGKPPAPAPTVPWECPGGTSRSAAGACVDMATGKTTKPAPTVTKPQRLTRTSSVLAAANGTGGTTAENAAAAAVNGAKSSGGKMKLLGRVGKGVAGLAGVTMAWDIGQGLGNLFDSAMCSAGVGALCVPEPPAEYVPNDDVILGDPGWMGAASFAVTLNDGNRHYSQGSVTIAVDQTRVVEAGTSVSGASPFAYVPPPGYGMQSSLSYAAAPVEGSAAGVVKGGAFSSSDVGGGQYSWSVFGLSKAPQVVCFDSSATSAGCEAFVSGAGPLPGTAGAYRFPGNPARPPEPDPDPVRNMVTTVTCADGSTVTAQSADFHETDSVWPPIAMPSCPPGTGPTAATVDETGGAGTKPVWTATVPDAVVQDRQAYPECGDGGCILTLRKIGPEGERTGDCFERDGLCESWFQDPDKATNYECLYGLPDALQTVALSECNVYAPTFNSQDQATGTGYADPATGETPAPDPTSGGGTDSSEGSCWGSGWSWNPVSFVLVPVKCALMWAFVPSDSAWQTATGGFVDGYKGTSVYRWWSALDGVFSGLSGGSAGCSPWTIDYPMATGGSEPVTVLNPCTGSMATAAGIARTVSTVVLVLLGGLGVVKGILGVGFGIPIRLGGSSGGDV